MVRYYECIILIFFEIMNIFQILQKMSLVPSYLWDKMQAPVLTRCMKHCGKGVYIRPMSSDIKGLWNLSVGDGTSIPKGSTIYCTDAACTIGKKVLFGPNPTIITGDHRIDIMGKYITNPTVDEKFVDGWGGGMYMTGQSSSRMMCGVGQMSLSSKGVLSVLAP